MYLKSKIKQIYKIYFDKLFDFMYEIKTKEIMQELNAREELYRVQRRKRSEHT